MSGTVSLPPRSRVTAPMPATTCMAAHHQGAARKARMRQHSRLSASGAALRYPLELFLQSGELLVREPLEIDEAHARAVRGAQQLVEFQLQRAGVAVLRVLQQKSD